MLSKDFHWKHNIAIQIKRERRKDGFGAMGVGIEFGKKGKSSTFFFSFLLFFVKFKFFFIYKKQQNGSREKKNLKIYIKTEAVKKETIGRMYINSI